MTLAEKTCSRCDHSCQKFEDRLFCELEFPAWFEKFVDPNNEASRVVDKNDTCSFWKRIE